MMLVTDDDIFIDTWPTVLRHWYPDYKNYNDRDYELNNTDILEHKNIDTRPIKLVILISKIMISGY